MATLSDMKPEISARPLTMPTPRFHQLLSATPRGARLARLLAVQQLAFWGWPPACDASQATALVVGELAANAVTHGRLPGRGFRLTLVLESPHTLRVRSHRPARRAAGAPGLRRSRP